jgi:hypothetical protein
MLRVVVFRCPGKGHDPDERDVMNTDLRRRTDEVLSRITQLRDSL